MFVIPPFHGILKGKFIHNNFSDSRSFSRSLIKHAEGGRLRSQKSVQVNAEAFKRQQEGVKGQRQGAKRRLRGAKGVRLENSDGTRMIMA